MIKASLVLILIVSAGCKGRDDCEKLLDRLPALPGGHRSTNERRDLAECRENISEMRKSPTTQCIIAAETDEAARKCVEDEAHRERRSLYEAQRTRDQAVGDAQIAEDKLKRIETDLDVLNDKIARAGAAVADAQSDVDRASAKARLAQLQQEQHSLEAHAAQLRRTLDNVERSKGVHISKECLDNPLAKGC